jgi:hypothetical protein
LITLPFTQSGGVVTLEEKKNEIALKSADMVETEIYSDEEIAEWDKE